MIEIDAGSRRGLCDARPRCLNANMIFREKIFSIPMLCLVLEEGSDLALVRIRGRLRSGGVWVKAHPAPWRVDRAGVRVE